MKSLIKFTALIIFLLTVNSCNSLLEEDPNYFYTEETTFNNENSVESAVNGLYYSTGQGNYYGSDYFNVVLPTSGLFYFTLVNNADANSLNINPNNIFLSNLWQGMYRTIYYANIIISNLEKPDVNLKNKNSALGHAYFLRGHAYLNLFRYFGRVPIRIAPSNKNTINEPRADISKVIQLIIDDLNKAKNLMPNKEETINARPSKWAAYAYLAKLYIFIAPNDPSNWQKAKNELSQIIDSQKFLLLPNYADVFKLENENSAESMFEIQNGHTGLQSTSDIVRAFTPPNSFFSPPVFPTGARIRSNKEVFSDHLKRYPTDPRIKATFIFDTYQLRSGALQNVFPKAKTGGNSFPYIAKWFDSTYNGVTTERNYLILRYSDVLLMMAEVENEISGPNSSYTFVNQVLTRARNSAPGAEHPANWSNMTKEEFRSRIMSERRYELFSEGDDWFDTRRRGFDFFLNSVIKVHNSNPDLDKAREFIYPESKKNMLLPIPTSELRGNQSISINDQNEGY